MRLLSLSLLLASNCLAFAAATPLHGRDSIVPLGKKTCTVHASGNGADDAPALLAAVSKCGKGGKIILPDKNYTIAQPITTELHGAEIELHGFLSFTPNVDYWVKNSYRVDFQNQSTAWFVTGSDFVVDALGSGGIFGNGQTWYSWSAGASNSFGRPISLTVTNATRGIIRNFNIIQPQFWATFVIDSKEIAMENFYINATNTDPRGAGQNWVQNTDGGDSYRSSWLAFKNFTYQGGDDCFAFKGNSSNVYIGDFTCYGSNGIAIGSLGQYPDRYDIVENALVENIVTKPSLHMAAKNHVYFKSWIGEYVGTPPNGGGGGSGIVRNMTFRNLYSESNTLPLSLTSTNSYIKLNSTYANTSTLAYEDIHFYNVSGTSSTDKVVDFECSTKGPCTGWTFEDFNVKPVNSSDPQENFVCQNFFNSTGLSQCHG